MNDIPSNKKTVYAIIVTYNGAKWIDKCFNSLVNSSTPLKILAIDNASTDGTPQLINEYFPQVELIETGENLGFGKANNIGLKRVLEDNADYAFLLNQDAWIETETINKLIDFAENNTEYGILSPIHLNGDKTNFDIGFVNYTSNSYESRKFHFNNYIGNKHTKETIPTGFINAACWLVSKKCLDSVGGFNPIFPHYGEDGEYFKRALIKGFIGGICVNTCFFHDREIRPTNTNQSIKKDVLMSFIHQYLLKVSLPQSSYLYISLLQLNRLLFNIIWGLLTLNKKLLFSNSYFTYLIVKNVFAIQNSRKILKSNIPHPFL